LCIKLVSFVKNIYSYHNYVTRYHLALR